MAQPPAYHGPSAHTGIGTSSTAHTVPAASAPPTSSEPHTHTHAHAHETPTSAEAAAPSHAEANKAHYDAHGTAEAYDRMDMANEAAEGAAAAMLRSWEWDEESTRCMDYACGTGLVSRQLAPHCKLIIGVDISQSMVSYYNTRVSNQGIDPNEMRAIRADLPSDPGELAGMEGTFDVVVCSQAYHHFADIEGTTKTLAAYLKPGGALLVVDLMKSEHALHMHTRKDAPEHVKHTVAHKGGLEEPAVRKCFDEAGLGEWSFETAYEKQVEGRTMKLFIAKGVKPKEANE